MFGKEMQRLICKGNSGACVFFVIFCMTEFGLWYYFGKHIGTHTPLAYRRGAVTKIIPRSTLEENGTSVRNFTTQIWKFPTLEMEKIYLYKRLLTKEHFFNDSNLKLLRNELRRSMGVYFNNYFIIDQQNTPENYTFEFGKGKNLKKMQITEDIYKLLPNTSILNDIPRCSVVGNSGAILDTKCGKNIDKADFVLSGTNLVCPFHEEDKCNAAPLQAFAVDAGNKSNLTTFNPSILRTRYNRLSSATSLARFLKDMEQYHGYLWTPCYTISGFNKCIDILKIYNITENKFVMGHPGHIPQMQTFWRSRGLEKRMSTGFYLVNVALTRCREVHLHGFWPFLQDIDEHTKDTPYHYFDKLKYGKSLRAHEMHHEFSVLLQLHLHGVLKMHVGRCDK